MQIGTATISVARNARKRDGMIVLPMVRGFVMARERNEWLRAVQ